MDCKYSERILCFYTNATSLMQIIRLSNISSKHLERVVFPGERLFFEAVPNAKLEIHTGMMEGEMSSDRINCNCLRVTDKTLVLSQ